MGSEESTNYFASIKDVDEQNIWNRNGSWRSRVYENVQISSNDGQNNEKSRQKKRIKCRNQEIVFLTFFLELFSSFLTVIGGQNIAKLCLGLQSKRLRV